VSGALASAVAILFVVGLWFTPSAEAQKAAETQKAAEVLAKGAEAAANPKTVHIVAKMRTEPNDNFSGLAPDSEPVLVEIWKQFGEKPKWRVEKPGRVAAMDGASVMMLIRPNRAIKFSHATESAFDTDWMLGLTKVQDLVSRELRTAQAKGWDLKRTEETTASGEKKLVVTVEAKASVPDNDYVKDAFFDTANTRRVYRFDAKTQRLEGFDAYLHRAGGDVLIWTIERIEYDQPISPAVFTLELPQNVSWYKEPERLSDNAKYEKMTPKEAAKAFFEACGKEDWKEVEKYWNSSVDDGLKGNLGGVEVVSIGEPFQSAISLLNGDWFVPYEIKLKDGTVKKWNLALRPHKEAKRFIVDGGI
jgi:hypothetical protein